MKTLFDSSMMRADDDTWWSSAQRIDEPVAVTRHSVRRGVVGRVVIGTRRKLRRSPRLKRATILTIVGGLVVFGTVWSVGVIYLNNVIIKRSAELGRLDKERRILRTQNAILSAQAAKLSAPTRIVKLATKRLGMIHPEDMAQFLYLDPANRPAAPRRVVPVQPPAAPTQPPTTTSVKPATTNAKPVTTPAPSATTPAATTAQGAQQ